MQVVSEQEGTKLADEINATFILASAKLKIGIDEIPEAIISKCISVYGSSDKWTFNKDHLLELETKQPEKASCCANKNDKKSSQK